MDLPLTLAAQSFQLAPSLQHSALINGLQVVKNASAKTYLRVTKAQWRILELFAESRTVPTVLSLALDQRVCVPLGEFYELILKAVRARILIEPGVTISSTPVYGWRVGVRPKLVVRPLIVLLVLGTAFAFAFHPALPGSVLDVLIGLVVVSVALTLGSVISACVIHGAGGEVLPLPWRWWRIPPYFAIDTSDTIMLASNVQLGAAMAKPAMLATAAALLAWERPAWSFLPLLALAVSLRPIFGGKFAGQLRFRGGSQISDAEQSFLFPPNHRPQKRLAMFRRTLRQTDIWARLAYGIAWALAVLYIAARLTENPPWTMAFWEANGERIALAVGCSLAALVVGYFAWEMYFLAREHVRTRRSVLRRWHRRWSGGKKLMLLESDRIKAMNDSPLFRTLPPTERQNLARQLVVTRHGAWTTLPDYGPTPAKVSIIVSGRIGLYRKSPSGQLLRAQILAEGDIIGLHDVADPKHPEYYVRTLTPVTLFTLDRSVANELAIDRMQRATLANTVLKLPFLKQISLCQNWHFQAVERFAALSVLTDIAAGGVIFPENQFNQDFFVIFENRAEVSRRGKRLAIINAGDFFGEIGLLQNSPSTAQVGALDDIRCLSIDRVEFLRFVTHNYTVALELERVSSKRLGRPIFPLKKGNFRPT